LEHIFHGEVKTGRNGTRRSVGFHYEGAEMQAMKGTKPTTITRPPDANGVYEGIVDIQGVQKRLPSTFFPKNWTKNDVVKAVNEAYSNGKSVAGKPANYIEGKSSSGVWVGMYLNPDKTVATAFPLYGR
ncbi:MAG: EndoU domain-containing protein, partial [Pyrinomonadaceae bacterium]